MKISFNLRSSTCGLSLLFVAVFIVGCATSSDLIDAQTSFRYGSAASAASKIDKVVKSEGARSGNRVLNYLEQGAMHRSLAAFEKSTEAFQVADESIRKLEQEPDVKISKETLALFTNPNNLPYRGKTYDKVMLSTYLALNSLQVGERDQARNYLFQAYERQSDAVAENQKRIQKSMDEIKAASTARDSRNGNSGSYDVDQAINNRQFQSQSTSLTAGLNQFQAYSVYVNPFSEFVQALYFLTSALDASDAERARVSFERLTGMVPENKYLKEDYAVAQRNTGGEEPDAATYVIFETGTAPIRIEQRIDIPLFFFTNEIDYIGANFPKLQMNYDYLQSIEIQTAGKSYRPQLLCDMDSVVAQEFKNELPLIITKTIAATATKAITANVIRNAVGDDNGLLSFAARVAATTYQMFMNEADLRTWSSLPKQIHYARFPTPDDNKLRISAPGSAKHEISLSPNSVNVIYVKSINSRTPLEIFQFSL